MIAERQPQVMSPEEYLEWEVRQGSKYEYANGEVYAMTGGTIPHSGIAVNFTFALGTRVQQKGCRLYNSDAKVGITDRGPFFYPDVSVTCDDRDRQAIEFIRFPLLIVEVLSPSTEHYDRGEKFASYRCLESLREYVLVSAEIQQVECFRLNERSKWELTVYKGDEDLELTSVDLQVPMASIYANVVFSDSQ